MATTVSPGLRLREATQADREAVCALLAEAAAGSAGEAHHAPPGLADPDLHDWLYWNNPWGPPANMLWEQEGRVVAHAGLYRNLGLVEGREVRVGRTAHAITSREFRGRGLFGSLARRQRAHLGEDIDLLVALPTAAAVHGLEGAGVTQRDRAQRWFRPIDDDFTDLAPVPRPLAATMARMAFGPRPHPEGEPMDGIPDGLDELARATHDDGTLCDATWWRWRFLDNPTHTYQRYARIEGGRVTAAIAVPPDQYFGATFLHVLHWQAVDEERAAGVLGVALADAPPQCLAATLLATESSAVADWARVCGLRRLPSLMDETSGTIAIAGNPNGGAVVPTRHWSISLAAHHDR